MSDEKTKKAAYTIAKAFGLLRRKEGRLVRRRVRRRQHALLSEVSLYVPPNMSEASFAAVVRNRSKEIGDLLGCRVIYEPSGYVASGSGAFGRSGTARGGYLPASITVEPANK